MQAALVSQSPPPPGHVDLPAAAASGCGVLNPAASAAPHSTAGPPPPLNDAAHSAPTPAMSTACSGASAADSAPVPCASGGGAAAASAAAAGEILRAAADGAAVQFELLLAALRDGRLLGADRCGIVLDVLVGGKFDLECNFIIKDAVTLSELLKVLALLPEELQAELWSVLSGLLRRSRRNQVAGAEACITEYILRQLPSTRPGVTADLMIEALDVSAAYSITPSELRLLLANMSTPPNCCASYLKDIGCWPPHAPQLMQVLAGMPRRHGPDEFFSFYGQPGSAISMPPVSSSKWPYLYGWTFSTWLYLDPLASSIVDQGQPYIYCFQTKNEAGYSARFLGSVLVVTTNKSKGKGQQHSVQYNFEPRRWYMVTVVHIYSRWRTASVKCYVDGQFISGGDLAWPLSISEPFDKCYFGNAADLSTKHAFSGQMSAMYVFSCALEPAVIAALHQLGPSYKNHFEFESECPAHLPEKCRKTLYDGKLTGSVVLMYSPAACDSHVCLDSSPRSNASIFVHSPGHALMTTGVKAVATHSVSSALHSLGGLNMVYPLFSQLSCDEKRFTALAAGSNDGAAAAAAAGNVRRSSSVCTLLMTFLCDMMESSIAVLQQFTITRGFQIISHCLEKASPCHLNHGVLECFIRLVNYISAVHNGGFLFKQLHDHIIFNYTLWSRAPADVQLALYEYTATDYLSVGPVRQLFTNAANRTRAIVNVLHALKTVHSLVDAKSCCLSRAKDGYTPSASDVMRLRGCLLLFIDRLISRSGIGILDVEMEAVVNYLTVVQEEDDLFDVLYMCVSFVRDYPSTAVSAFDRAGGVSLIFKLLRQGSEACSEPMRLLTLKLFGSFLACSTAKRKQEAIAAHNLFSLLAESLLMKSTKLTVALYNVLLEILLDKMDKQIVLPALLSIDGSYNMENPALLKVIAELIERSEQTDECRLIRETFLKDIYALCRNNVHNKRSILQLPVWQEWLFSLLYTHPSSPDERHLTDLVLAVCHMLIMHAVKYEYGGWCVWIDSMALLHYKVCREEYKIYAAAVRGGRVREPGFASPGDALSTSPIEPPTVSPSTSGGDSNSDASRDVQSSLPQPAESSSDTPRRASVPRFQIADFYWSSLHQYLLSDLIGFIELELASWKKHPEKSLSTLINEKENVVFVSNSIHLICHLSDILISSAGGLLPLLSAVTSGLGQVDVLEPGHGLTLQDAVAFLLRVCLISDLLVSGSSLSLTELESERNMKRGAMVRQCLRMVCACAVRNCLECVWLERDSAVPSEPLSLRNGGGRHPDPVAALVEGARALAASEMAMSNGGVPLVEDRQQALQEHDTARLRGLLDRCLDEDSKVAERMALAVVFFVSSIMVAKYKRLLESLELSPQPPHRDRHGSSDAAPPQPQRESTAEVVSASTGLLANGVGEIADFENQQPSTSQYPGVGLSSSTAASTSLDRRDEGNDAASEGTRACPAAISSETHVTSADGDTDESVSIATRAAEEYSSFVSCASINDDDSDDDDDVDREERPGEAQSDVVISIEPSASHGDHLAPVGSDSGDVLWFDVDGGAYNFQNKRRGTEGDGFIECGDSFALGATAGTDAASSRRAASDDDGIRGRSPDLAQATDESAFNCVGASVDEADVLATAALPDAMLPVIRNSEPAVPTSNDGTTVEPTFSPHTATAAAAAAVVNVFEAIDDSNHLEPSTASPDRTQLFCDPFRTTILSLPSAAAGCQELSSVPVVDHFFSSSAAHLPPPNASHGSEIQPKHGQQAPDRRVGGADSDSRGGNCLSSQDGELQAIRSDDEPSAARGAAEGTDGGSNLEEADAIAHLLEHDGVHRVQVAPLRLPSESAEGQLPHTAAQGSAQSTSDVVVSASSSPGIACRLVQQNEDDKNWSSMNSVVTQDTGSSSSVGPLQPLFSDSDEAHWRSRSYADDAQQVPCQSPVRQCAPACSAIVSLVVAPHCASSSLEAPNEAVIAFDDQPAVQSDVARSTVADVTPREDGDCAARRCDSSSSSASNEDGQGAAGESLGDQQAVLSDADGARDSYCRELNLTTDASATGLANAQACVPVARLQAETRDELTEASTRSTSDDAFGDFVSQPRAASPVEQCSFFAKFSDVVDEDLSSEHTSTVAPRPVQSSIYGISSAAPDMRPALNGLSDYASVSSTSEFAAGHSPPSLDSSPSDVGQPYEDEPVIGSGDGHRSQAEASANQESQLSVALERALHYAAPYLKEVMLDFLPYLTRRLVGSKGQPLLVSSSLSTVRDSQSWPATSATTELVMMLCSREWQVALQKHAALAFIELVNEGRLLAHAMRQHFLKVAREGEAILLRFYVEDTAKHAQFKALCNNVEERMAADDSACVSLLRSVRSREAAIASRTLTQLGQVARLQYGCALQQAGNDTAEVAATTISDTAGVFTRAAYLKLDTWEDACRRRRRLIPNPRGSSHPDAVHPSSTSGHCAVRQVGLTGDDGRPSDSTQLCEQLATSGEQPYGGPTATNVAQASSASEPSLDTGADIREEQDIEHDHSGTAAFATACRLVSYTLVVKGTLSIGRNELYFEMDDEDSENKNLNPELLSYIEAAHGRWQFSEICAVANRRYLLQNIGLEVFFATHTSALFVFESRKVVRQVVNFLPRVGPGPQYGFPCARRMSLAAPSHLFKASDMTQRWRRREVSNFEYLMYLNTVAGRGYNDLNQYPVFPWVLSNYDSSELDLSQPSNYRDLSKPVGALNPLRKAFFDERYASWEHGTSGGVSPSGHIPPFHYGTHYSTAAYVLNWLMRLEPFTTAAINLYDGKFDHPNRMFSSISAAWANCQRDTSDVKEVIPEFYYMPEMYVNSSHLNLGRLDDDSRVDDVILPPWAKDPSHFVHVCRQALESEVVSCQLHEWIDLVFGYKQTGPEAVRSTNVFYYLTYEGSVDFTTCVDPVMKEALENQIRSFGQTPAQLLTEPHPPRGSLMHVAPWIFTPVRNDICMSAKFLTSSPVVCLAACAAAPQLSSSATSAVVSIFQNRTFAVNKWKNDLLPTPGSQLSAPTLSAAAAHAQQPSAAVAAPSSVQLPLEIDPMLSAGGGETRRVLADHFDERLQLGHESVCVSQDSQSVVLCGFWDKSFRVYSTSTGSAVQAVFGHYDIVSCLSLSEWDGYMGCFSSSASAAAGAGCRPSSYLVTGSWDCTCFVWLWNGSAQPSAAAATLPCGRIVRADEALQQLPTDGSANPSPLAVLHGHRAPLVCCRVSAELGLVASLSKGGACLVHTISADLLHAVDVESLPGRCVTSQPRQGVGWRPTSLLLDPETYSLFVFGGSRIAKYHLSTGRLLLLQDLDLELNVLCATTSRDGLYFLIGGGSSKPQGSGFVSVVRASDLIVLHRYPACSAAVHDVTLSLNHKHVLAGIGCGAIVVYNVDFSRWHHDYRRP